MYEQGRKYMYYGRTVFKRLYSEYLYSSFICEPNVLKCLKAYDTTKECC